MTKSKPIFYQALLLTGVNLLLRFASTSFQVFLSGRIGAAGIGLLQLVLSVGGLSLTIGMGGIRTATMYLCAEMIGQRRKECMPWVLSGCVIYSVILSSLAAIGLYHLAPLLAAGWIGEVQTEGAIRLLAIFLPVNCLCGVMAGYYTGVNRIGTLAAVEVAEQLFSMVSTVLLLKLWAGSAPSRACQAVILGSGLSACLTLGLLLVLTKKQTAGIRVPIGRKLLQTAIPLAVADSVKSGISTAENLMVPKRLALFPGAVAPLAAFGIVCGMVFPLLMFPAAILYGLCELLIPELARCSAAGSHGRICHLTQKSVSLALLYGCFCGGILFLAADRLCLTLYDSPEAGSYLRIYALLAPMLYCDCVVDAVTKGLGKQKICVRYNIITSALDVMLLFVLLPRYGMNGYFTSFLITHLINFILSFRLLLRHMGSILPARRAILILTAAAVATGAGYTLDLPLWRCLGFSSVFLLLLVLMGIISKQEVQWVRGLITARGIH